MTCGQPDYGIGSTNWKSVLDGGTIVLATVSITGIGTSNLATVTAGTTAWVLAVSYRGGTNNGKLSIRNTADTTVYEIFDYNNTINSKPPDNLVFPIPIRVPAGYDFFFDSNSTPAATCSIYFVEVT